MSVRHSLPQDMGLAFWATSQALNTASWLLTHIDSSVGKIAFPDMPATGAGYLHDLAKWLEIAYDRFRPLELYLCTAFDEPAQTDYGYSSCHFAAGLEVADRILDTVWTILDHDGCQDNLIRTSIITKVWKSSLIEAEATLAKLQRPTFYMRIMLFKEAARATLKRDGQFLIVQDEIGDAESETRCAKRDAIWCEWYLSDKSGCAGSPTKIGKKWNALSEVERRTICSTAWQKVPQKGLRDTVRKAIERFTRRQGIENLTNPQ